MGTTGQETHRPGVFKQTNKSHKTGRHRSKGSINKAEKGKVNVKTLTKRARKELGRDARRHQSMQLRQNKRDEVLRAKRQLGGLYSAPILVTIIPLQEDLDTALVLSIITSADDTANVAVSPCGVTHISIPRFKQRFSLLIPPVGNTLAVLDAAKVSTTVLFVSSATERSDGSPRSCVVDDWGNEIVSQCLAQGLPTSIVALINLDNIPIKKRQETKQHAQDSISKWLPEEKIMQLDKSTDALNLLRRASSQKQRTVSHRNKRPYLLAENIKYVDGKDNFGTLEVTGFLRGKPLSVNRLVHIPGFGDYQLSQIDISLDPYSLDKGHSEIIAAKAETSPSISAKTRQESIEGSRIIAIADPSKQESLETENVPDPMDAEQTWPTEEEIAQAEAQQKRKIVKLVPKGTSEYQAAWIPDEDAKQANDDEDDYESDDEDDDMRVDDAESEADSMEGNENDDEEDYETVTISEAAPDEQRYDQQMDLHEERQAMENIKKAKLDAQFPDEVDTPQDIPAKVRFQKYRGLESFRTSPWDPKENLPLDYARIFQFENFDRTRRRIYRENEDMSDISGSAEPGSYVTIHVKNFSRELFDAYRAEKNLPMTIFGLLPNEQKMSLVNVTLKRTASNTEPIKSKERLVFQCGFRRFTACPIFSQHTNGSKHKYERYFQPNATVVASFYAPITFPPCPVMCYMENKSGLLELVATGSILSVNPDRIIVKRVVLSGHPFKVHKRSAVVRFMFFNREDIMWFKPVQLRTKYGRRGHIKEPLGTHGHMKCVFDGQLKSQDTILLNLFKRVFPKWTYEPCLLTKSSSEQTDDVSME